MTNTERLLLTEKPLPTTASNEIASFFAVLESTGELVVVSHKPLVDGARELIARGFDPATPLTMRHAGNAHDSFTPMSIGHWAKWTYTEPDKGTFRMIPWRPRPDVAEGQKSGSEPEGGNLPIPSALLANTAPVAGQAGASGEVPFPAAIAINHEKAIP
jgi:hypothetical protein